MKKLLSENMNRFGTKNITNVDQKSAAIKSVMHAINEYGLRNQIKRYIAEAYEQNPDMDPSLTMEGPGGGLGLNINGVQYDSLSQVAAAIEDGSLTTLPRDIIGLLNPQKLESASGQEILAFLNAVVK